MSARRRLLNTMTTTITFDSFGGPISAVHANVSPEMSAEEKFDSDIASANFATDSSLSVSAVVFIKLLTTDASNKQPIKQPTPEPPTTASYLTAPIY
jgi:hypothetical protein